jgi:hypothetical protein
LLLSSFNRKSSLAVEAVEAEVDARAEVVEVEAVPHVRVEDSRLRRLPLDQPLRARPPLPRPLGQVPRARRLVLGLQVVQQPLPGQPAALLPARLRKAALAPAAVRQGKVLPLRSVRPEEVQMSRVAVQRLAR